MAVPLEEVKSLARSRESKHLRVRIDIEVIIGACFITSSRKDTPPVGLDHGHVGTLDDEMDVRMLSCL